jgi:Tol biopolymer transport system component
MSLGPGTRLGPYEIQAAIGAGGMGEVYRARDTRLDRTVAVKILPDALAVDPQFRERFEREARVIAGLTHPHICTLHDVGHDDGTDYLVLEYLEGQTLADRLLKGALPLEQALVIAIQIAGALDKAHQAGIVHRDLKPGNIMLVRRGGPSGPPEAKLLDFGLAKTRATVAAGAGASMLPTTPPGATVQGTILGTFQYMAPEQLEGQEADARSDIFAFGAVVYEMVTGRKAFEGRSQASLIAAILEHDPPPLSSAEPLAPRALDHIVEKCLAKHPEDRWQTAADLRSELRWVSEGATEGTSGTGAIAKHRRSTAWMLGLVAALAIAALAVPATLYFQRLAPEPVVTRLDVVTPPGGDAFSFALSSDGRQLAFVANGDRGLQLWLRPLDQAKAQPLAGTEGAAYPFWAPDGRALGFFADGKLKRIDLDAGTVQMLADAPQPRGGTWNTDGVIVFAPSVINALMRVGANGGAVRPVTRLAAGQGSHRWPQFLPDGRRFLFFVGQGQPEAHGAYVGSLDGGESTRVMPSEVAAAYATPGYLLVVSQGVLSAYPFDAVRATVTGEPVPVAQAVGYDDGTFHSAFSVSQTGVLAHRAGAGSRRRLVWSDRTGKTIGAVGQLDENGMANPELAPDDQRVAVNHTVQGNIDLWLIDVNRGVSSRFTFDPSIDSAALWSPDGNRVVFRSTRKGTYDLFEKPASGTADEQPILVTPQGKSPLEWSHDGRSLLYSAQGPNTASDLWVFPMIGERKPFPVLQSRFDEIEGQFSPDGRWLAYVSNESGRYEVYIRTFPQVGGKWQVSAAGGMQPRWSRDGRELYYLAQDARLMAVPIRVASDKRTLEAGAPVPLFPSRLATGGNIPTGGFQARAQYAVAADGRFLMNVADDDGVASPITIVQNWDAALKK